MTPGTALADGANDITAEATDLAGNTSLPSTGVTINVDTTAPGAPSITAPEIVRTIVTLARNLGMGVIAEGVETEAQVRYLRDLGCGWGQGYYFSPPLPLTEMQQYLAATDRPGGAAVPTA